MLELLPGLKDQKSNNCCIFCHEKYSTGVSHIRRCRQIYKEQGLNLVDNSYFITERRKAQLLKNKNPVQLQDKNDSLSPISKFGTVGCVALDKNGNLSAGTSTGGRSNKKWGRVGDVPIIGAGNYANNNTCAISATGWGEFFIRNVVAHDISSLLEYKNLDIETTKISLEKVKKLGGSGGVIVLTNLETMQWNLTQRVCIEV